MKIQILGVMPIPVGHRVSVRWYHKETKGLFGGKSDEAHANLPVVEDLDTGVSHMNDWVLDFAPEIQDEEGSGAVASPKKYPDTLGEGIVEKKHVVGRITACRVITTFGHGHLSGTMLAQTDLTIEEEQPPYR